MKRRTFLQTTVAAVAAGTQVAFAGATPSQPETRKPRRLKPGDTIGFVSPGGSISSPDSLDDAVAALAGWGVKTLVAPHALGQWGYYSGRDEERAGDINRLFADPSISAIMATRGGSGCNRLLPLLDYNLIRQNPKILVGYSDITALLNAVYTKTGLITFHGPVATSDWTEFTRREFYGVLFGAEARQLINPAVSEDSIEVTTITPGTAKGRLVGGNLSVVATVGGSEYLPDWSGTILFLEDVEEDIYRIDRMLMQLKLAGVLDQIGGFIFGHCSKCEVFEHGFTLREVLDQHIKPLGIPAWSGSMIGHIHDKFTVPVGLPVEIDAARGIIRLSEPAVL